MKDPQQSISNKGKYDPREIDPRQNYLESGDYHSYMGVHKGEKGSGYSQKGSHYMDDDPKLSQTHHPYAYTQQTGYSKNDSGSKKDAKGQKDSGNLYLNQKGQYPQGRKGKLEASNMPMQGHQSGYYPQHYPNQNTYQMVQGHKHPKSYMPVPPELGHDDPNDDPNFDYADLSHQEKINKLMKMNGDPSMYHEMSHRGQGGLGFPPASEFSPG